MVKVALLSAGLIGSSMAHVMRRKNLARHNSAYMRKPKTLEKAKKADFAVR